MSHMNDKAHASEHGPTFQMYIFVFIALCVGTGLSFLANLLLGQGQSSFVIIMLVAVVKATLVAMIFMHLKFDWNRVYCIVIPVSVMAVMMMIVFLPDMVFAWTRVNQQEEAAVQSTKH